MHLTQKPDGAGDNSPQIPTSNDKQITMRTSNLSEGQEKNVIAEEDLFSGIPPGAMGIQIELYENL